MEKPAVERKPLEIKVSTVHQTKLQCRSYRAPGSPITNQRSYIDKNNCPDTGADIMLAGTGAMKRLGVCKENLHKNSVRVKSASGRSLEVWGFLPVLLEVGDKATMEILYFAEGVTHMLVSRGALQNLGIIGRSFPEPEAAVESAAGDLNGNEDTEEFDKETFPEEARREQAPDKPSEIPYPPTEENIGKLEEWLKRSSSSAPSTPRWPLSPR